MSLLQKLKKISVVLMAISLILSLTNIPAVAVSEKAITITASSDTVEQGKSKYAYVYIDSTEGLASLEISVYFDASNIKINNIYNSVNCSLYDGAINTDNIQFSYIFDGVGESSKTKLFYFEYQALDNAELGPSQFNVMVGEACDKSLNDVEISGSSCEFEIIKPVISKSCAINTISSISTAALQEFTVEYRFNTQQIASGTAVITYDAELFEVIKVTNGQFLTDKIVDVNTDLKGEIYVSFVGTQYNSHVNFISVTFKTRKNVSDVSKIKLNMTELVDKDLNYIACKGCETEVSIAYDESHNEGLPSMRLEATTSNNKDKVILKVCLDADSRLGAGDFTLTFDPNVVTFSSGQKNIALDMFNIDERNVANGELKFHIISLNDIISEETVLTVEFDIKNPSSYITTSFSLVGSDLTDSLTNAILLNFVDTSIKLGYLQGDVNGNELLNDRDAIYLLYNTFNSNEYPLNQYCDFNGDGVVTDRDAVYLLYHIFKPVKYPLN